MLKGKNIQKATMLHLLLTGMKDQITKLSYYEMNILARVVGNMIFDMSPVWSGYKSKALLAAEAQDPSTKKCAEHFYPRQVAGWRVVEHMCRYRGISKSRLFDMLSVFTQVHYTTADENTRLVPFQKYGTFISPEHSYKQAGIDLVPVKV